MKTDTSVKRVQIIDAALRRFSHFGIQKTTLGEIADDLSISKQALFYYFPDKQSIARAVEERILNDYTAELTQRLSASTSVKSALVGLVEIKKSFFQRYFMLASEADNADFSLSRSGADWKRHFQEEEMTILIPVLNKGIERGELMPLDVRKTVSLLLETLYAFRKCLKDKSLPDASSFEDVFSKQIEIIDLFYNGLRNR